MNSCKKRSLYIKVAILQQIFIDEFILIFYFSIFLYRNMTLPTVSCYFFYGYMCDLCIAVKHNTFKRLLRCPRMLCNVSISIPSVLTWVRMVRTFDLLKWKDRVLFHRKNMSKEFGVADQYLRHALEIIRCIGFVKQTVGSRNLEMNSIRTINWCRRPWPSLQYQNTIPKKPSLVNLTVNGRATNLLPSFSIKSQSSY